MISLAPYRVTVLQGGKTIPLWNPGGGGGLSHWAYDHLYSSLGKVQEHGLLSRSRIARISKNADGSVVCGIVQTGENGFTSELVHTETGKVNHKRQVLEAEFMPFFFLLACPLGADFGVLLLQRFKNLGIRDYFANPLVENFSKIKADLTLRINRLVPADLAGRVLNDALVKEIRLIKYTTDDEASVSLGEGYKEKTHSVEMVFKSHRDGFLPKSAALFEALRGEKTLSSIYSVDGFDYDSIKVDLDVNGRRRVIDLGKPSVMTPNIDVSEDLQMAGSGHPEWSSLVSVFGKFAEDSLIEDGFTVGLDLVMAEDHVANPLPNASDPDQAIQAVQALLAVPAVPAVRALGR